MRKISWGVLSTAKIGLNKVIPAMQAGKFTQVDAIASRDLTRAREAARRAGIPRAYGSYEELLADPEIEAVYIPLPNHLHVEWTVKALEAGKHVLCEKPVALSLQEGEYLLEQVKRFPHLKVMEAFMYRFHPQWQKVKALVTEKTIGALRYLHAVFAYCNEDETNIRNQADIGGGGLLDIGCYCISVARLLFNAEPLRVCGSVEYDPVMKIDRLVSGLLEFPGGTSSFTCSTQLASHQQVDILGTRGKIELRMPFTPSPKEKAKILLGSGGPSRELSFPLCDQYTLQGDFFSRAILDATPVPTLLSDGVANLRVIDRLIKSAQRGLWMDVLG